MCFVDVIKPPAPRAGLTSYSGFSWGVASHVGAAFQFHGPTQSLLGDRSQCQLQALCVWV